MENNEILAELAMSIGQIVDKKVAEKKPTLVDAYKMVLEAINNGDLATDEVADLLEAINNESTYDEKVGDLVRNEADNYDFVYRDDVDEDWIFDNVSDTTIRDVALRYVNDNL
jgi:hypothetical protein